MKDDKLEKQFDEYFKGVNTPDNITGDAKKYVKRKDKFLPKFVKFASVAASFVLVFAVSLTLILHSADKAAPPDSANPPSEGVVPPNDGNSGRFSTYLDADLSFIVTDPSGGDGSDNDNSDPSSPNQPDASNPSTPSNISKALKFIQTFEHSGASVTNYSEGYMNGKLALVRADVSMISGISRHDTKVYVEFTDEKTVYSPLQDYFDGNEGYYNGVNYYLTRETAENGEPVNKLQFTYNSVKYYFYVTSSDENSYKKYLQTIIK